MAYVEKKTVWKDTGMSAWVWFRPDDKPMRREVKTNGVIWLILDEFGGRYVPIDEASGYVIENYETRKGKEDEIG